MKKETPFNLMGREITQALRYIPGDLEDNSKLNIFLARYHYKKAEKIYRTQIEPNKEKDLYEYSLVTEHLSILERALGMVIERPDLRFILVPPPN